MTVKTNHRAPEQSTDSWENEGGQMPQSGVPSSDELQIELKRYGIAPVTLTVFDWGGYRYSSAREAIAAAKRLAKPA